MMLLLWMVLSLIGVSFLDKINIRETSATAQAGSCVTINCTFPYLEPVLKLFWIKDATWNANDKEFDGIIVYSTMKNQPAPEYTDRVKYLGNNTSSGSCSLSISNLQEKDSGHYHFRYIGNKNKYKSETSLNLQVNANPCKVSVEAPKPTKESELVTVRCSTSELCTSHPEWLTSATGPNAGWLSSLTRPNLKITHGTHETSLTLRASWQDDGTTFSCRPAGSHDSCLVRSVTLKVEYAPIEIKATVSSEDVEEGKTVTLGCSSRGHPKANFTWFKNGQAQALPGGMLPNVKPEDSGEYYCEASNKHGKNSSNIIKINVKYAPKDTRIDMDRLPNITEGEQITLTCRVQHNNTSELSYSWYKDDTIMVQTEQRLLISRIKSEDSGFYYCNASNSVGHKTSHSIKITVEHAPRQTRISPYNNQVKVGSLLTLTCETDAIPLPNRYSWYHSTGQTSHWAAVKLSEIEQTLRFERAAVKNAGWYICNARNTVALGMNSTSVRIDVLYPPTKPVLTMQSNVREFEMTAIDCSVQSFPVSTLSLIRKPLGSPHSDKLKYVSNNTLQFSFSVHDRHAGLYTCRANNSEGQESTEKDLEVMYVPKEVTVSARPGTVLDERGELELTCRARSNPNVSSYTWVKSSSGQEVTVGKEQRLTLQNLSASDSGQYLCSARNEIGTKNSTQFSIRVKYAPKHTKILTSVYRSDGESPVALMCSAHSDPAISRYRWFREEEPDVVKTISAQQNLTVAPENAGTYYCIADNDLGGKKSDKIKLFLNRGAVPKLMLYILPGCPILIGLTFFLCRRFRQKRSTQQRGSRNDTHENQVIDAVSSSELWRSRDNLSAASSILLEPRRSNHRPESPPSSKIHTVYDAVKLPRLKQMGHSPSQPRSANGGHVEDDSVNYASLNFARQNGKPKRGHGDKRSEDVYAKVPKRKPKGQEVDVKMHKLQNTGKDVQREDYENMYGACAPRLAAFANTDTDTSEDGVDENYSVIFFRANPGHRGRLREHPHHSPEASSSDEEDYRTKYSDIRI